MGEGGPKYGKASDTDTDAAAINEQDHTLPTNDLSAITAALLLTTDCMGTGILALPADVQTLGMVWGIIFLITNLPINLYAGTILSNCASFVEDRILNSVSSNDTVYADREEERHAGENDDEFEVSTERHGEAKAKDFVGLASLLFDEPILTTEDHRETRQHPRRVTYDHPFTKAVLAIYYINIFLVLGNYILVMSHAVDAMAGEKHLCIPTAGIIASTLMFGLSQLRTMANLGRSVSAVSLLALLIVVVQCLVALQQSGESGAYSEDQEEEVRSDAKTEVAFAKMSALASIAFAVGSQKLLLNIRHEMEDRKQAAPKSLSIALVVYGLTYTIVCVLAGDEPPPFLFDAIPAGLGRTFAGLFLWIHVSVSYAINSQALCSSLDRLAGHRLKLKGRDRIRWSILTALVAVSSYLVANAVPFFKDLVALCGALTSIPLTLLLPALLHRRVQGLPLFFPTLHGNASLLLVVFSVMFIAVGLSGAIGSIDEDWSNKSTPFACH